MGLQVSTINFEGRKNPKLKLRRRQIKNLKNQENELKLNCETLKNSCKALGEIFDKTSTIAYDNPKATRVNELWKLRFDTQYSFIYGSYSDYKNARKAYAKEAVKDLDLLKYVKTPIRLNGVPTLFSKIGRNMCKNAFLDKFRRKTPEEKQLMEFVKNENKNKMMRNVLGVQQ